MLLGSCCIARQASSSSLERDELVKMQVVGHFMCTPKCSYMFKNFSMKEYFFPHQPDHLCMVKLTYGGVSIILFLKGSILIEKAIIYTYTQKKIV